MTIEQVAVFPQDTLVKVRVRLSPTEVSHVDLDSADYEDLRKAIARMELCLQLILEGKA